MNRKLKIGVILLLGFNIVFFGCRSTKNSDNNTIKFREISYGLYRTTGSAEASNESPSGRRTVISNYSLIRSTDTIDAVLGETFGMEYSIVSSSNKPVTIKRVWVLPKEMVDNRGNHYREVSRILDEDPNYRTVTTYELEEDFEIIPGDWILKFYNGDKLLYQRKFVLVKR